MNIKGFCYNCVYSMCNYSNTSIYKIVCKDPNITDLYVGHTTCFTTRQNAHKSACSHQNNQKLYKTIREKGGWSNWDMIEIVKYNCKNIIEARMIEQEYYEKLKATLNSIPPYNKKYVNKILPVEKSNNNSTKSDNNTYKFCCEICNIYTNSKKDYNNHIKTNKHIANANAKNGIFLVKPSKIQSIKIHRCDCGSVYKYRQGLYKHKMTCSLIKIPDNKNKQELQNSIVIETIQEVKIAVITENNQMQELQNTIITQNNKIQELQNIVISLQNTIITQNEKLNNFIKTNH